MFKHFSLLTLARKAGGRCGFAESVPEERITALKVDETAVETTDVMDGANDIVQKVDTPLEKYPFITGLESLKQTQQKRRFNMHFSERIADLHSKRISVCVTAL